ncbi:hypothetical protein DdX_03333 [Ditylenchus destructor]|uniref:Uncharacterized protein n=1 Tax=Ditylenchus destructor TaxID=166010 RepID=A0AAD4NHS2_9BILA|nr:hypothetical protein DdX_03333 [Ditylenchus destructor]
MSHLNSLPKRVVVTLLRDVLKWGDSTTERGHFCFIAYPLLAAEVALAGYPCPAISFRNRRKGPLLVVLWQAQFISSDTYTNQCHPINYVAT